MIGGVSYEENFYYFKCVLCYALDGMQYRLC